MGKRIKKGTRGEAAEYMTRSQAIRYLQLGLKDFRRLCILKGIYPREPKKKFKGNNKTYYHIKDIKFLENDSILSTFRKINAHMKKIKRMEGRKEHSEVEILKSRTPVYSLQHVIKERYPNFEDALRDLDDAMCLVALYASLPTHKLLGVNRDTIKQCQKLNYEFMLFCTISKSFTKSFLSIKGIYYQAEIIGQPITWIVPYKFTNRLPFDIDYSVMNTFLEFYQQLLRFINFKLFQDFGLEYPPERMDLESSDSFTFDLEKVYKLQAHIDKSIQQANATNDISDEFKETDEYQQLIEREERLRQQKLLFKDKLFYLNRECPIYSLEPLILSFGGRITKDQTNQQITYHVIDRDMKGEKDATRDYIQPQWVYDCINNQILLPVAQYAPGVELPPHISPFPDPRIDGAYIPTRQQEINTMKGVSNEIKEMDIDEEKNSKEEALKKQKEEEEQEEQNDAYDDESSSDDERANEQEKEKQKEIKKSLKEERLEMGKLMMTKKERRLYSRINHSNKSKRDFAQKLDAKRRKYEK